MSVCLSVCLWIVCLSVCLWIVATYFLLLVIKDVYEGRVYEGVLSWFILRTEI